MTWVAVAIGGSTLVGAGSSYLSSQAEKDAAANQAGQAILTSQEQQKLNQPYMFAGNAALNPLLALYGINGGLQTNAGMPADPNAGGAATPEQREAAMQMFYASPEYNVQKSALDKALERQASAGGVRYSPSTALGKAEIAGRSFGDWRNQMSNLAQMGPAGARVQGATVANLGANMSNAYGNIGAANSNLYGAVGQTANDAIGQFSQYKQYQDRTSQLMAMLQPGGGAGAGAPMAASPIQQMMPQIQRYNF